MEAVEIHQLQGKLFPNVILLLQQFFYLTFFTRKILKRFDGIWRGDGTVACHIDPRHENEPNAMNILPVLVRLINALE